MVKMFSIKRTNKVREITPLLIIAVLVTLFKKSLISVKKIKIINAIES